MPVIAALARGFRRFWRPRGQEHPSQVRLTATQGGDPMRREGASAPSKAARPRSTDLLWWPGGRETGTPAQAGGRAARHHHGAPREGLEEAVERSGRAAVCRAPRRPGRPRSSSRATAGCGAGRRSRRRPAARTRGKPPRPARAAPGCRPGALVKSAGFLARRSPSAKRPGPRPAWPGTSGSTPGVRVSVHRDHSDRSIVITGIGAS
jgi:hypothetical protein